MTEPWVSIHEADLRQGELISVLGRYIPPELADCFDLMAREILLSVMMLAPAPKLDRRKLQATLKQLKEAAAEVEAAMLGPPNLELAVMFPLRYRLAVIEIAHAELIDISGQGGARAQDARAEVAYRLAKNFEVWTQQLATTTDSQGGFVGLLADVYGVLGIDASAVNQAKNAIKRLREETLQNSARLPS
jgi:hypothetical protein